MVASVDAGPIIGVESFPILDNMSVRELEQVAFIRLAYLFWRLSRTLATQSAAIEVLPIQWSGRKSTRQMYKSMCDLPLNISKSELELRIRAFNDDFRALYPTVTLHGVSFRVTAPTTST